jgi:hypothetical protein
VIEKNLRTATGWLKVKIPSHMNEITFGQLMAMQEKENMSDMDAISILSGTPLTDLIQVISYDDFQLFADQIYVLAQQISQLYNSDALPKRLDFVVDGKRKVVNVIQNLSVEPAGAFMASREIIADEIARHINVHGANDWQNHFSPSLKACCQVLAHYFYCRVCGSVYNEYEADEFAAEIKKLKAIEALPIAKYFFLSYPNLSRRKTSFWRRLPVFWRKKQVSAVSKNSGMSIPSML